MSGPTIVTHDNLVDIWNVKIGQNDLYGPRYDVAGSLAEDLETKIVKTILGEGDTAATSITDFKTDHATGLAVSTTTHKLGGAAVPANGMLEGVQVTQQFKYRNAVLVADYLDNADANATNEAARGTVAIKPSAALTTTQTKILPDSSAFENATVRLTVTDPYEVSGASFQDASGIFTGEFDRSNTEQTAKYRYTRNVNANCANDAGSASITVAEHTAWNKANWGAGGTFINGYVTLDASSGIPNATLYGDLSANNILSSSFNSTGENANNKGFDISYNYVVGQEPIVGRYSLSWAGGTSGDSVNPITIETNNMTDLVVVADKNDYTTFLNDTTTPVTLAQLPTDLTAGSVVGYLTENDSASLNPGFNFIVTANAGVPGEVLVTTTHGISSPIAIDASGMSFSLKNKYYLEQSVPSTVLLTDSSANLLNTTTVEGGVVDGEQVPDVTVTNSLTITNGSLTLTGTDAARFEIVDGTESLGATDYNTNGKIDIYPSEPESSYSADHYSYPRSFGGPVGQDSNGFALENFASTCFVHYSASEYSSSETGLLADVGVLATADKSIDISYNITTLASQTTGYGPAYLASTFGNVDGAAAFILGVGENQQNSAIAGGDITFSNNDNTYTDGELTVVDLKCQKKWSDNGIVGSDGITAIEGVAVDVVASNMSAVGLADIVDLKIVAAAKELTGLSSNMRSSFVGGWSLSLAAGNSKLKSSLANQGVISDANIITILGGSASTVHDITLNFAPAVASVPAREFTKFHNKLDITYDGQTQTTYDDEFTIIPPAAPAVLRVYNSEEVLSPSSYILPSAVAGKTLVKRSYTETFSISTPFRLGNYSNLMLTTPTFTQTTTYYVLKDGSRDLPRNLLSTAIHANGDPLLAEITTKVGEVNAAPLVAHFVRDDLKPYTATVMKQTTMGGTEVTGSGADIDVWYNTITEITQTGVGTFTTNVTLSPVVSVMEMETFTVHLTLANGSDTFEFAGKMFSAAEVDALTTKNPYSINLATATGTSLSGTTQYTRGAEGATHTLTGGGYTFTMNNNIYVDIRVYACPNGLFKVVKNGGEPTYKSISNLNSTPYLKLDSGVRVQGHLDTADYEYHATWTLTNDAISVNTFDSYGETDYTRIPALNYEYRPYDGWKGVSNKWLRGFNINHYVTIVRTPSTFVFDIAGYTYQDDLYAGLSYQHADVGNLRLSTSGTAKTMFAEAFDEPKPFPLRIKYGSYRISDITGTDIEPINTPIVPAYKTVISFRKGVRIISKSLSTKASAEYSILYSLSDTLNVRRLADYTSTSTTLSEFTANGEAAGAFTMTALKTGASNLIGNVLNIRYLGNGDIPNLTCFLTIAPAFLKFQAVDHTTTGAQAITSIPFTKHADQLLTQYKAVSHSAYEEGVAVSQSWNPFAGSDVNNISVNNMTISAIAKTFEQYRTSAGATRALNVDPHKLTIEYASGYGSAVGDFGSSPVFDDIIPLTDFTDSKVKLESDFDGEGTLKISLHQKNITTNGAMPTVIFDETDSYNLVIELGSHLLTPTDGEFSTDLEFSAGDCTGLTTYCIDSIYTTATDFKVKIARYSNASGVNSDLFNASISGGIAVGGSVKETIELSTPLTEEPGDLLTVSDLLTNIKDNMASVARPGWATVTDYNANSKVVWLKPTSAGGKTDLRTALLLSKYVPRSVTIFELDDAHRIMDNQGVAVYRVASQGKVYSNTTSATSDVGALLHLANALAL
jgi:hypothetical protein